MKITRINCYPVLHNNRKNDKKFQIQSPFREEFYILKGLILNFIWNYFLLDYTYKYHKCGEALLTMVNPYWIDNYRNTMNVWKSFLKIIYLLLFIVALQCCVRFYCRAKRMSSMHTYIPLFWNFFPFRSPQSTE